MNWVFHYLSLFKSNNNYLSSDYTVIKGNVYTQSKLRFFVGCCWVFILTTAIVALVILSGGCFVTAPKDKVHEWLYVFVGIIILFVFTPMTIMLLVYMPHFFISAIIANDKGILLPLPYLLARKFVLFSDIKKMSVESNGLIVVKVVDGKYFIPKNIDGLSQLLWYINEKKGSKLQTDEFINCRVEGWEGRKENETERSLLI